MRARHATRTRNAMNRYVLKTTLFDVFAVAFLALHLVADFPLWRALAAAAVMLAGWIAGGFVVWAIAALGKHLLRVSERVSWRVRT